MSPRPQVMIAGTGRFLPSNMVTNQDLEKHLDTSDEWIVKRTGIKTRYFAGPEDTTSNMGAKAARIALERAGKSPSEVGLVLFATVSPDYWRIPFCAALVQQHLQLPETCMGFDVSSGCAGFVQALQTGCQFIQSGTVETALIIGAETMTSIVNQKDRSTAVIFGDGAGAAVLTRSPEGSSSELIAMSGGLRGDEEVLITRAGGSKCPLNQQRLEDNEHFVFMKGREIFRFAVGQFASQITEVCKKGGVSPSDVKLIVPHQVNYRILESAARRCEVPMDRVVINLDRYGNTSGATVPMALDEAVETGRLKRGDLFVTVAFGSGLAWASALFRF